MALWTIAPNLREKAFGLTPRAPYPQTLPTARQFHFLGDSHTFGHGLTDDEIWPNQLQKDFSRRPQLICVVNCGVPAANNGHYWRRPPRFLENTSPGDFLVIGLTWNDFTIAPRPLDLPTRKADFAKLAIGAQQSKEPAFLGLSDAKTFQYDFDLLFPSNAADGACDGYPRPPLPPMRSNALISVSSAFLAVTTMSRNSYLI